MTSSSSSAPARNRILRGSDAVKVNLARIDADLRSSPYVGAGYTDARLVDPVLAKAFEEAVASARLQAHEDGFAQGYAEGLELAGREKSSVLDYELSRVREAEEVRERAVQEVLERLDDAAQAFAARQAAALSGVEDLLLGAALDLATTLLGRELEITTSPVSDAIRRALSVMPADVPVNVSMHPLDVAALGELDVLTNGRAIRITADPDVEPGSCIADGGSTHVDASLAAAIERVRQVLTP
jgi:flagellar assembly protein FliH